MHNVQILKTKKQPAHRGFQFPMQVRQEMKYLGFERGGRGFPQKGAKSAENCRVMESTLTQVIRAQNLVLPAGFSFSRGSDQIRALMSPIHMLEARQLTKTYPSGDQQLTVLRDVSFTVPSRSSCAIVGPSGSGKTTLLGLCAGLDQATSGEVILNGQSLGALNEDQRARLRNQAVGFVFQNFQLIATLTALENVMVPLELRGEKGVRPRALELLAQVGLSSRTTHYPAQLSGGEQQRVALARAFINQPKILFADEPTGNLDNDTSHQVVELLFRLNQAAGTALVLVTHNQELAQRADRVIRLQGGTMMDHPPANL